MTGINDYPNAGNYPVVHFPQPIPPPEVDPDEGDLIYVGYNIEWQEYLMAALWAGLYPSTWQGTDEEKITALNRAENFRFLLTEPVAVEGEIPTPFWDEEGDVDDQAPADMQGWYGYVDDPELPPDELTFFEDAAIWAFTGFIALATWEIGAAPAILFRTIAPRFTLAMRRGDVGEIIRILIDGEEAGRVDTSGYSVGELVEFNVMGDPSLSEHELMIVQVE